MNIIFFLTDKQVIQMNMFHISAQKHVGGTHWTHITNVIQISTHIKGFHGGLKISNLQKIKKTPALSKAMYFSIQNNTPENWQPQTAADGTFLYFSGKIRLDSSCESHA